ncbi:MAG TPA: hypothetical protein VNT60_00710, partial [Deinococcales bacterium]|nr:hypothetical protein [Deinococcales bacterium]
SALLERLAGGGGGGEYQSANPVYSVDDKAPNSLLGFALQGLTRLPEKPAARALIEDLNRIQGPIFQPVATALRQYVGVATGLISHLGPEIAFYAAARKLIERAHAVGLPMCRPAIAPADERACDLKGTFDLSLLDRARTGSVVLNDARFDDEGRVLVLTGPNGGGKTTFTRAVGLSQALFQVGLFVPAEEARLSPVDAILTHFPAEERPEIDAGRLAEESGRLSAIFRAATRHSLILLNESLASTSPGESLYMARDIARALKLLGARAIFNTHLHELAAGTDDLNASTPGDGTIASIVAGAELEGDEDDAGARHRRTYRIRRGPPVGLSYAREIARQHGISYEQIAEKLEGREAAPAGESG